MTNPERTIPCQVRVKPLVWEQMRDGAGHLHHVWAARCPLLQGRLYAESEDRIQRVEAKRAALILSALDLTPAPAPDVAGLGKADALARFTDWFRKNYPGPDTIIHKPDWHAPRIFRAALAAMEARNG